MKSLSGKNLICRICAVLVLFYLVFAPTAASAAGQRKRFKEAGIKMAMVKALETAYLKVAQDIPGENDYKNGTEFILSDTVQHKVEADSRILSRRYYESFLKKKIERHMEAIHKHFNPDAANGTPVVVPMDWLQAYADRNLAIEQQAGISANMERYFDDFFRNIRDNAVAAQKERLSGKVYPTMEDIEQIEAAGDQGTKTREAVIQRLMGKIGRELNQELLAEVETDAEDIARKNTEDGEAQYKVQMKIVDNDHVPPDHAVTEHQIADAFKEALKAEISRLNQSRPDYRTVYGIFPSIQKKLLQNAKTIETQRFIHFMDVTTEDIIVNLIDVETIRATIKDDLSTHKQLEHSLNSIAELERDTFNRRIVDRYVQTHQVTPADERSRFAVRLTERLKKDASEIRSSADHAIKKSLRLNHANARVGIAIAQVKNQFSNLADGKSVVSDELMESFFLDKTRILEKGSEDKSFDADSFDECLGIDSFGSASEGFNQKQFLDESETMVHGLCRQYLHVARNAYRGQNETFEENEDFLLEQFNKLYDTQGAGTKAFRKENILAELIDELGKKWVDRRQKRLKEDVTVVSGYLVNPANEQLIKGAGEFKRPEDYCRDKYTSLFSSIKKRVERLITAGFEKKIQAKKPPPEDPVVLTPKQTPEQTSKTDPAPLANPPQERPAPKLIINSDNSTSNEKSDTGDKDSGITAGLSTSPSPMTGPESRGNSDAAPGGKNGNENADGSKTGVGNGFSELSSYFRKFPWLLILLILAAIIALMYLYHRYKQKRSRRSKLQSIGITLFVKKMEDAIQYYEKYPGIKIVPFRGNTAAKLHFNGQVVEMHKAPDDQQEDVRVQFSCHWQSYEEARTILIEKGIEIKEGGQCEDPNRIKILHK